MSLNTDKNQFIIYIVTLTTVASFSLGLFFGRQNMAKGEEENQNYLFEEIENSDLKALNEAWEVVTENYIGEVPDKQTAMDGAIKGMVESVGDPYTVYFTEEEIQDFESDMEGSFEGIGAQIGIRDDIITIVAPLDGMPAEEAGLKPHDKVLKIDDESTMGMSIDEAVKRIRGPKGSEVRLSIYREDENNGEPIEIKITRGTIDIKSVKWEMKEGNIAYLRISGFLQDTEREFYEVVREIEKSDAESIVLDLRSNPGGYLYTAVDIAGAFLPKGSLVVEEDYGSNSYKNDKQLALGEEELLDYPIVILINEGTASASEILAGAINDHREETVLIGKKTFGKGLVQNVEDLKYSGSVKITIAKWLTPNGININEDGIEPEIEENFVEKEKLEGDQIISDAVENGEIEDLQLKKGVEVLKEQMN